MLDENKGIYISVAGKDPTNMGTGLASLSDKSTLATGWESTSWQMVDLGHSWVVMSGGVWGQASYAELQKCEK